MARVYCFALTPSPSFAAWARGVGAHGSAPASQTGSRCFALTPSPSFTAWARGAARGPVWSAEASASAWAEASLPHSTIPLSRRAREGGKGGEGNTARLPVLAPASAIPCRTAVPSSGASPCPLMGRAGMESSHPALAQSHNTPLAIVPPASIPPAPLKTPRTPCISPPELCYNIGGEKSDSVADNSVDDASL